MGARRKTRCCTRCGAFYRAHLRVCLRDGERLIDTVVDPMIGRVVAERYTIDGLIGEGGMGRVYSARHLRFSRRFAIKVLFGDVSNDPKMQTRFAREAEAASRLAHPNVVGVVDFGDQDGLLYLVMEYADGTTLGDLMRRDGRLEPGRIARFTRQLAEGLAHAHGRGLVHRDFKPDNVVVGLDDEGHEQVRIVDFGIAMVDDESDQPRITTDGTVIGTPQYMAPEQATATAVDHRADLYALGVVVYEMLSGVLPFEGGPVAIARQHVAIEPPAIARRVPGLAVDPVLEDLAMRLMAKSPDDRPESAREVVDVLTEGVPGMRQARGRTGRWDDEPDGTEVDDPGPRIAADGLALETGTTGLAAVIAAAPSEPSLGSMLADVAEYTSTHDLMLRRRRLIAGLSVAVLGVAAAVVIVLMRGGGDARGSEIASIVVVDGAVAEVVPLELVDAGVEPVLAPGGDGARARPRVDAGAAVSVRGGDARPPRDRGGDLRRPPPPRDAVPDAGVPAADPAVTAAELGELYRAVGAELNRAVEQHGDTEVEPLRRRYLAIAIGDAMRRPVLRPAVVRDLGALRTALRRLGK